MGIQSRKRRSPQPGDDKRAVFVNGNARISPVKLDRLAFTGIAASPTLPAVAGSINAFADKKRVKINRICRREKKVGIRGMNGDKYFRLSHVTRMDAEIFTAYNYG